MPQFYFNVHDGKDLIDDQGLEFPNADSAREAAVCLFGLVLKEDASLVACGAGRRMEVTDQAGSVLFRLGVTIEASVAAKLLLYQA